MKCAKCGDKMERDSIITAAGTRDFYIWYCTNCGNWKPRSWVSRYEEEAT